MFGVTQANEAFKRTAADRELTRALRRLPSRFAGEASTVPVLSSTLGTDTVVTIGASAYKGILSPGTVPTEVPQADPSALVSFPAYLGTRCHLHTHLHPSHNPLLLDDVRTVLSPRTTVRIRLGVPQKIPAEMRGFFVYIIKIYKSSCRW